MLITTTTTTIAALSSAAIDAIVGIAIVTCLVLLLQKEIAGELPGWRARRLSGAINSVLLPLLIAAGVAMIYRIVTILS